MRDGADRRGDRRIDRLIRVCLRRRGRPLSGSTNAMFLGGTAKPTPSTAYVEAAESLYLSHWGLPMRDDLRHGGYRAVRRAVAGADDARSVRVRAEQSAGRDGHHQCGGSRIRRGEHQCRPPADGVRLLAERHCGIRGRKSALGHYSAGRPAFRVHRRPERRERDSHQHLWRPGPAVRRRYHRDDHYRRPPHGHQRRPIRPRRLAGR